MSYQLFTVFLLTFSLSVNILGGEGGGAGSGGHGHAVDISSTEFSN